MEANFSKRSSVVDQRIPAKLTSFLEEHIHSIWALELLLFLWQQAKKRWDAIEVNNELRGNLASTKAQLALFAAKGLLTVTDTAPSCYQFNRENRDLGNLMELLSKFYSEYRNKIIDAIYSPKSPIESFADAFILRKGKKDG